MRIAKDYELDCTGKIFYPGEIIFDEISINKKITIENESRSIQEQENIINNQINSEENIIITEPEDINKNTENKQEDNKETIEQEIEDNTAVKTRG